MSDVMTYDMEIAELDQAFDMELDAAIYVSGGGNITFPEDSTALLAWNEIAPNVSTEGVKNMARMFYVVYPAQGFNPDFSGWDTSQVENMSYMFYGCNNADFNPDISSWDVRNVKNMSYMFDNCYGAAFNPDLSNWNVAKVSSFSATFQNCYGAAFNPDLHKWDTGEVTDFGSMFSGCYGANFNPNVKGWDTSKATNFNSMFNGCHGAAFDPDLDGWDTSSATNMYNIFYNIASSTHKKIWVPKTFVATGVSLNRNKPFVNSPGAQKADVYTDATDADSQGWGTPNANYIMHYNSTHDDFLNA